MRIYLNSSTSNSVTPQMLYGIRVRTQVSSRAAQTQTIAVINSGERVLNTFMFLIVTPSQVQCHIAASILKLFLHGNDKYYANSIYIIKKNKKDYTIRINFEIKPNSKSKNLLL